MKHPKHMKYFSLTFLALTSLFIISSATAGTITLADGTTITSPKIDDKQTEISVPVVGKTVTFTGKNTSEKKISKPFYYFDADPNAPTLRYKQLIQKVGPAVVTVVQDNGLGSGFIIHPDGYVITNQHVISGSYKGNLRIKFHTTQNGIIKHELFKKVRVIAVSPRYDIALLKIEGFKDRNFPYVSIATGNQVEKGDEVVAIGAPKGLERTSTKGYISLSNRSYEQFKDPHFQLVYIQHTAEINGGNSGGPLFNMQGQVVGINSLGAPGSDGIGFAISADFLKFFLENQKVYALSGRNMTSSFLYLAPPGEKKEKK